MVSTLGLSFKCKPAGLCALMRMALLVYVPGYALLACAAPPPRERVADVEPAGFVVLGPAATRDFDLQTGDTLAEVSSASVPHRVVGAARRQAAEWEFAPQCSRYFRAIERYLVLLVASCRPGEVVEDGQGMALYDKGGQRIGPAVPWLAGHYTTLQPPVRSARR